MIQDTVGRHDEAGLGQPLLRPMMKAGRRLPSGQVSLSEAREYCRTQLSQLPVGLRGLTTSDAPYPVEVSEALERDLAELREMREMASTPLAQNGTQRASSEPVPS
jgi:nicotinate phosphoribosyltransferase